MASQASRGGSDRKALRKASRKARLTTKPYDKPACSNSKSLTTTFLPLLCIKTDCEAILDKLEPESTVTMCNPLFYDHIEDDSLVLVQLLGWLQNILTTLQDTNSEALSLVLSVPVVLNGVPDPPDHNMEHVLDWLVTTGELLAKLGPIDLQGSSEHEFMVMYQDFMHVFRSRAETLNQELLALSGSSSSEDDSEPQSG